MKRNKAWTREQLIMALNVYCKIPFKDVKEWHPLIQKYAPIIGRTPVALKMKIGNFGRFDPFLKAQGIVGLSNGSKDEELIWNEFWDNPQKLAYESERLIAERAGKSIEDTCDINVDLLPEGEERETIVRTRVNQQFFRSAVLCSYHHKCCISGFSNSQLLEACHISSWKSDVQNRVNPRNGLCMNIFFHRAYDRFLLAITPDYEVVVSESLIDGSGNEQLRNYLSNLQNKKITMPEKFAPDAALLDKHYREYLKKM